MRTISSASRAELYAAQTTKVLLELVTLDHDDMAAPVRLVNDQVNITSRGNVYIAFPFIGTLPVDTDGELPQMEITCDAVTRELIIEVRGIATPATVVHEFIFADVPDTVLAGPYEYDLAMAKYDDKEIRLSLLYEPLTTEPYPAGIFNPQAWPLLFNAVDT